MAFVYYMYVCINFRKNVSGYVSFSPNYIFDRIVCRTGKLSGSNSSGDIVVTIDEMPVVWKTKFTYQVIVSTYVTSVHNLCAVFHCLLLIAVVKMSHFV